MLSKTAEYALRAVACMGSQVERPLSADFLAEKTKVPRRYLTRVLQDLCNAGLVQSRSGPGGGYELTYATNKTTILDVINTVVVRPQSACSTRSTMGTSAMGSVAGWSRHNARL